jgi:hypothetical protein
MEQNRVASQIRAVSGAQNFESYTNFADLTPHISQIRRKNLRDAILDISDAIFAILYTFRRRCVSELFRIFAIFRI